MLGDECLQSTVPDNDWPAELYRESNNDYPSLLGINPEASFDLLDSRISALTRAKDNYESLVQGIEGSGVNLLDRNPVFSVDLSVSPDLSPNIINLHLDQIDGFVAKYGVERDHEIAEIDSLINNKVFRLNSYLNEIDGAKLTLDMYESRRSDIEKLRTALADVAEGESTDEGLADIRNFVTDAESCLNESRQASDSLKNRLDSQRDITKGVTDNLAAINEAHTLADQYKDGPSDTYPARLSVITAVLSKIRWISDEAYREPPTFDQIVGIVIGAHEELSLERSGLRSKLRTLGDDFSTKVKGYIDQLDRRKIKYDLVTELGETPDVIKFIESVKKIWQEDLTGVLLLNLLQSAADSNVDNLNMSYFGIKIPKSLDFSRGGSAACSPNELIVTSAMLELWTRKLSETVDYKASLKNRILDQKSILDVMLLQKLSHIVLGNLPASMSFTQMVRDSYAGRNIRPPLDYTRDVQVLSMLTQPYSNDNPPNEANLQVYRTLEDWKIQGLGASIAMFLADPQQLLSIIPGRYSPIGVDSNSATIAQIPDLDSRLKGFRDLLIEMDEKYRSLSDGGEK